MNFDREIYLGSVTAVSRGDRWEDGCDFGMRLAAHGIAENVLRRHVIERRDGRYVQLLAVEETERERAVIAEGLARFEAAAQANPALRDRGSCA